MHFDLTRDGHRIRLVGTDGLELEGTMKGKELSLRGPEGQEFKATFKPMTVHEELASITDSKELWLLEDLVGGLPISRRSVREKKPALVVEVERIEIAGDFAPLNQWGELVLHNLDGVRSAAEEQLDEVRRINPSAVNDVDLPGASLHSYAQVVLVTDRFVSVHEDHSVYTGGAHPQNATACTTFDRSTKRLLKMSDVFAVTDITAAVTPALEGLTTEVSLSPDSIEFATRSDAQVCLTRIGVWLSFALPHAMAALDGISVPYPKLRDALRPGVGPRGAMY